MTEEELRALQNIIHAELSKQEESTVKGVSKDISSQFLFEVIKDQPLAFTRMLLELCGLYLLSHLVFSLLLTCMLVCLIMCVFYCRTHKDVLFDKATKLVKIRWEGMKLND
jgi:hypothetical protein